ncbi:hypothetical protein DXG01_011427 [Tephrocybe rancida]|nr:hypothetical protein DXG01_011427 [Tephrocybe rancida]
MLSSIRFTIAPSKTHAGTPLEPYNPTYANPMTIRGQVRALHNGDAEPDVNGELIPITKVHESHVIPSLGSSNTTYPTLAPLRGQSRALHNHDVGPDDDEYNPVQGSPTPYRGHGRPLPDIMTELQIGNRTSSSQRNQRMTSTNSARRTVTFDDAIGVTTHFPQSDRDEWTHDEGTHSRRSGSAREPVDEYYDDGDNDQASTDDEAYRGLRTHGVDLGGRSRPVEVHGTSGDRGSNHSRPSYNVGSIEVQDNTVPVEYHTSTSRHVAVAPTHHRGLSDIVNCRSHGGQGTRTFGNTQDSNTFNPSSTATRYRPPTSTSSRASTSTSTRYSSLSSTSTNTTSPNRHAHFDAQGPHLRTDNGNVERPQRSVPSTRQSSHTQSDAPSSSAAPTYTSTPNMNRHLELVDCLLSTVYARDAEELHLARSRPATVDERTSLTLNEFQLNNWTSRQIVGRDGGYVTVGDILDWLAAIVRDEESAWTKEDTRKLRAIIGDKSVWRLAADN